MSEDVEIDGMESYRNCQTLERQEWREFLKQFDHPTNTSDEVLLKP